MSFLSRLFGRGVPEWASFFSADEYRAFVLLLREDFDRRGRPYRLYERECMVLVQGSGEEPHRCGLLNLAQVCHQAPREGWPETIRGHFDRMLDGMDAVTELQDDFERARELLKVRLYPEELGESLGRETLVYRPVGDGLIAVLVYDFPDRVSSVHRDHVQAWNRPLDELFATALENVKTEIPVETATEEIEPGVPLLVIGGDAHFAATHALLLDQHLRPASPYGALVAIPHRHAVLCHPITDMGVIRALNSLILLARGMYEEGPGSITPQIYWWRTGKFTLLPAEVTKKTIDFRPPQEFVEQVLEPLSQAPA